MDNANIKSEDSNERLSINRDIADVLDDMFMKGESPITVTNFNVTEHGDSTVSDTVLNSTTYTYPTLLKSIKSLIITAQNVTPLMEGDSIMNLLITSSFGDVLLDETFTVDDAEQVVHDYELAFSDMVGATMKLINTTAIDGVAFTIDWTYEESVLELSEDIYIPFEAVFKVSEHAKASLYDSKEMLEEEFMKWNPNGSLEPNEEITTSEAKADVKWRNITNMEYDWKIGYFFKMGEKNMELHYKPAQKAVVSIRHSYFPAVNVTEADVFPVHKAFGNCLVYGTTIKQLEKKLLRAADELEMVKTRTALQIYGSKYKQALSNYAGYNRRKSEAKVIKMFGFLDDESMLLY